MSGCIVYTRTAAYMHVFISLIMLRSIRINEPYVYDCIVLTQISHSVELLSVGVGPTSSYPL